jgi:hypothetical protein
VENAEDVDEVVDFLKHDDVGEASDSGKPDIRKCKGKRLRAGRDVVESGVYIFPKPIDEFDRN